MDIENNPNALQPIAIIGRGCCLPEASNLQEFWSVIREDRYTAKQIPPHRFDNELHFNPNKGVRLRSYADVACLTSDPKSEEWEDLPEWRQSHPEPTYRRLAAVALECLRDHGGSALWHSGKRGGVYVGHTRAGSLPGDLTFGTYIMQVAELLTHLEIPNLSEQNKLAELRDRLVEQVRQDMPTRQSDGGPAVGASVAAKFISDTFSWTGPSMSFNGACASSLQALHAAVRSLQLGNIDIAIAASASYCHSDTLLLFSQAQSLSATGSRPFDDQADGLVVGEGYVALMLKRLCDAIRDDDPIYGVVQGCSVASDGRGKSLWAPKKEGQVAAIHRAYSQPALMERVQYIEAHATSTQVGDATELQALSDAFADIPFKNGKIPIGSVKSNIGHTLETAGLAGVLKVLLCMEHQTLPAHTRVGKLNEKIAWDSLPFVVPRNFAPWGCDHFHNRWAAINGFGIGGLNAHVVLSQRPEPSNAPGIKPFQPSSECLANTPPPKNDSGASNDSGESKTRIAVIGVGCVFPGALNWNEFQQLVHDSSETAIRELPDDRWIVHGRNKNVTSVPLKSLRGGFVEGFEYDWRRHKVPPKQIASANPLQFMILDAVTQALDHSGIELTPEMRSKTGVVVGTVFGGDFSNQLQMGLRIPELQFRLKNLGKQLNLSAELVREINSKWEDAILAKMPALLDETGSFTSSSLASRITKSFDLGGGAVSLDAGNGSSGAALSYCLDQLLAGDNDYMICIGAGHDMSPARYEGWSQAGLFGANKTTSSFADGHPGIVPGEGCAVVLLKKLTRHEPLPLNTVCLIESLGISSGKISALNCKNAVEQAIAIDDAANSLEQIWFTPSGFDGPTQSILNSIASALGDEASTVKQINSRKSNRTPNTMVTRIGHTAGASGLAELLAAIVTTQDSSSECEINSRPIFSDMNIGKSFNANVSAEIPLLKSKPLSDKPRSPMALAIMGGPFDELYGVLIRSVNKTVELLPSQTDSPVALQLK